MAWTLTGQGEMAMDKVTTQGPNHPWGRGSRVKDKSHSGEESHRGALVAFLSSFTLRDMSQFGTKTPVIHTSTQTPCSPPPPTPVSHISSSGADRSWGARSPRISLLSRRPRVTLSGRQERGDEELRYQAAFERRLVQKLWGRPRL